MRKVYEAPALEIELYMLNANIASNCHVVTNPGPQMEEHTICDGFIDPTMIGEPSLDVNAPPYNVNYYEDTYCDCYTTGGDKGWWQS